MLSVLVGLRVLLVEPSTVLRERFTSALEKHRVKVIATASLQEALDTFKKIQPDLLLSCLQLPDGDGYSLLHQIRGEQAQKSLMPAIALANPATLNHRDRILTGGFQRYLLKPIEVEELIAAVAIVQNETLRQATSHLKP